jgi:sec-independent protein translocase protein TatC
MANNNDEMNFLEHLEVLRWHLIRSIIAIMLVAIVAFIYREFIFDEIILAPKMSSFITNRLFCDFANYIESPSICINNQPFQIINIKMAGQFSTHISVSIIAGFVIAFPYFFWEIWQFFKPALYSKEIKHARGAVFFTSILFTFGVAFGYYLIAPLSVHFLGGYVVSNQVVNQIDIESYIATITSVVLASGVVFELPMFIYFLSKIGLVTPEFLKTYRRHAIVLILILAAVITPPDIFSQILVGLPLIGLYEIGIVISKRVNKKLQVEYGLKPIK